MSFFEAYKNGCIVRVKLAPNAARCGFGEVFTDADGEMYVKAYITVAPEKGKANKELIKMLSKELEISKQKVEIISGQTSHLKRLFLSVDLTEALAQKLSKLAKEN